ncbi:MAG: Hsp20/alpha crystallin family protein [Desulfobacterales bacterium]
MTYRNLFTFPGREGLFEELVQMKREMDRFFGSIPRSSGACVYPLLNLSENRDSYFVRAELPGTEAGDIDIQASMNSLSLSGERKIAAEGENVKYHRKEREGGRFSRIIQLPEAVNPEKIEARMQHGILTVIIPKSEAAKPRQIKVK